MSKCLVTKLAGTVNNDSLLKIGELRLSVSTIDSPSKNSQGLYITANQKVNLTITGDGYFTNETLSENKGKTLAIRENTQTLFYVSNSNVIISLDNKYALLSLFSYASSLGVVAKINIKFDISYLTYSKNLTVLRLSNTQVSGDISALANLTGLTAAEFSNTQVSGNISALANLTGLTVLNIPNLYVDLAVVAKFSALKTCSLKNGRCSGDLSKLANSLYFVSFKDSTSRLTWTERDTSANIIAIEGSPNVDNIDKMLQDLANCKAAFPHEVTYYKQITATGTRTSASDAAVQTLQSKGYTVSITPA
nr:MAG TPA: Internalin K rich repeat protein [Caudoviricetes sp.]